jgi:hypothetical protein
MPENRKPANLPVEEMPLNLVWNKEALTAGRGEARIKTERSRRTRVKD